MLVFRSESCPETDKLAAAIQKGTLRDQGGPVFVRHCQEQWPGDKIVQLLVELA